MNPVPPHFHKLDRISETDLIPDGQVHAELPVSAEEGRWATRLNGATYEFWRFLDGSWRMVGGISLPISQSDVTDLVSDLADLASDIAGKADDPHTHAASDIVSGTLPVARGGTGQASAAAAFDALAPTTTQGDVIYHDGSDNVRLPKGAASQVLRMNAGATAPEWASIASSGVKLFTDYVFGNTGAAFSNTTTPQDIFSVSVPGGTLGTDGAIVGRAYISTLKTDLASRTFTFTLSYGSHSLTLIITGESPDSLTGYVDFLLMGDGATDAQLGEMVVWASRDLELSNTPVIACWKHASDDAFAEDSTATKTLSLTVQMSFADPDIQVGIAGVYVSKIN
jgi:hypothetical protein